MLDKSKNYLIVGLGLLGGRYAQVLSQKGYHVTGITHSQSTLDYACSMTISAPGKIRILRILYGRRTASSSASTPPCCLTGSSSTAG
ncbi:MAG: hypothetical protein ACLURG_01355 [Gemmiger sp.]